MSDPRLQCSWDRGHNIIIARNFTVNFSLSFIPYFSNFRERFYAHGTGTDKIQRERKGQEKVTTG